jgi:AcrR family transcriptional regulator
MREVANASGVGRATVYRHFANRDELLRAIRLRALRDCREALDPDVFAQASVRDALGAVLATLVPVLDRYRVLLDAAPPDRSDPEQRALTDAIEQPLRELIVRGQSDGELDPHFPPDFVLAVLIGVLRAAREAVAQGRMSAEAAHALAVRSLLAGIGADTSSPDH